MGAQNQTFSLGVVERVSVADGAVFTVLVGFAHVGIVSRVVELGSVVGVFGAGVVEGGVGFHGVHCCIGGWVGAGEVGELGVRDVEGVLEVAGGVLLGHEEGVEVPETAVDESKGRC